MAVVSIAIVLPPDFEAPIGGYAVAYEYANRLSARGHIVTVVHVDSTRWSFRRPFALAEARRTVRTRRRPAKWFEFKPGVSLLQRTSLGRETWAANVVIATSWRSAVQVAALKLGPERAHHLIQHHEVWDPGDDIGAVDAAWRLPLTRIVIARWLAVQVEQAGGGSPYLVPNGMNTEAFPCRTPRGSRPAHSVAMLWHSADWKGSRYGLEGLFLARKEIEDLHVELFGLSEPPKDLPAWITFHKSPGIAQVANILNRVAIFVSPSLTEGWPLPPAEALSCGCALISTDIPGVADYAHHEETALLVAPRSPQAIADALLRLVNDPQLGDSLAERGRNLITTEFTWDDATDKLESILTRGRS